MATKSNFATSEIQRLEMLRIMVLNQLDFLDKAIDNAVSNGAGAQTEEEFNFLSAQLINFQQHLDVAAIM